MEWFCKGTEGVKRVPAIAAQRFLCEPHESLRGPIAMRPGEDEQGRGETFPPCSPKSRSHNRCTGTSPNAGLFDLAMARRYALLFIERISYFEWL